MGKKQESGKGPAAIGRALPVTLTEVLGNRRLIVECHKGIECYGPEEIWLKTSFGRICLRGEGLVLRCMSRQQLCITGKIWSVELQEREYHGSVE